MPTPRRRRGDKCVMRSGGPARDREARRPPQGGRLRTSPKMTDLSSGCRIHDGVLSLISAPSRPHPRPPIPATRTVQTSRPPPDASPRPLRLSAALAAAAVGCRTDARIAFSLFGSDGAGPRGRTGQPCTGARWRSMPLPRARTALGPWRDAAGTRTARPSAPGLGRASGSRPPRNPFHQRHRPSPLARLHRSIDGGLHDARLNRKR